MPADERELAPLLVVGATGPLGRRVMDHARDAGIPVRAFARDPDAFAGQDVDVVRGDVRDLASLRAALTGVSGVVSALGSRPGRAGAHLLEEGTRNLVAAMRTARATRLLAVTGMGAGSSRGHGPFWYDRLVRPTILRGVYADKEAQELVIRTSGLDWTIVRPAVLVDRPQPSPVVAKTDLARGEKMGPLTRDDVARFLIAEAVAPAFSEATVHLFTETR